MVQMYIACLFQININGKHPLVMKNEEGKEANQKWQGTKLTFLARSHLAPKFSKVVAKAKKLGAIKKKDS